jgi:hypothetical protein
MRIRSTWCWRAMLIGAFLCANGIPAGSQGQEQHVVPQAELKKDAAAATEVRHTDEAAVRSLLSSAQGQKALQSANLDMKQVNKALAQLSDEDLAKLADKSRQAQKDFAAGNVSDHELILILVIVVAVLIIVLAVR